MIVVVRNMLAWLLYTKIRIYMNLSSHRGCLVRMAGDCLQRVPRCTIVGLSMAIDGTGPSNVAIGYRRLSGLVLALPTGIGCSNTDVFRPAVLIDIIQLHEILGKLEVGFRHSFEVLHFQDYISVRIQDLVVISPLCLELS